MSLFHRSSANLAHSLSNWCCCLVCLGRSCLRRSLSCSITSTMNFRSLTRRLPVPLLLRPPLIQDLWARYYLSDRRFGAQTDHQKLYRSCQFVSSSPSDSLEDTFDRGRSICFHFITLLTVLTVSVQMPWLGFCRRPWWLPRPLYLLSRLHSWWNDPIVCQASCELCTCHPWMVHLEPYWSNLRRMNFQSEERWSLTVYASVLSSLYFPLLPRS